MYSKSLRAVCDRMVFTLCLMLPLCSSLARAADRSAAGVSAETVQLAALKLPRPGADLKSFAALYATNGRIFVTALNTQFRTAIDLAVSTGFLDDSQRKVVFRRLDKQNKVLFKAFDRLLRLSQLRNISAGRFSRAAARLMGTRLRTSTAKRNREPFASPFAHPFGGKRMKSEKARVITGQLESYSGFLEHFFTLLFSR